ncbi:sigma-70 family RNA polymerase sigma factor [Actinotalea sp. JY-7876]|uniref:sigma-70 family RNA polymerase sigma factor n=1 Tax=Actinotalea sp. JY-7876 TaxID=2758442 RepID=UPI0021062C11|nr:sigma-70 family RNA polymerase sigma factor [Actinotalea sp. JY-7876]
MSAEADALPGTGEPRPEFEELVAPLRRELTAHCYRMVGSVHEAEDLVQETYLRAWRAYDGFEHRSSVRTWMYRIATNACLTALEGRARRPLPVGLGAPPADPRGDLHAQRETAWVEPLPDAVVWASPEEDPADVAVSRESVRLALVAALQELTAQQRAVVLLCDVLRWRAAEAAAALGLSVGAVTSTLQRARNHLARRREDEPVALDAGDPRAAELLARYQRAFEDYDMDGLVGVLTEDAQWQMPPFLEWFQGGADIADLIRTRCPAQRAGDMRFVSTSANGVPALAMYMRGPDGVHRAFQIQHPVVTADGVAHVTAWFGEHHFTALGLPLELATDPA